jgi:hypothetical protein
LLKLAYGLTVSKENVGIRGVADETELATSATASVPIDLSDLHNCVDTVDASLKWLKS